MNFSAPKLNVLKNFQPPPQPINVLFLTNLNGNMSKLPLN